MLLIEWAKSEMYETISSADGLFYIIYQFKHEKDQINTLNLKKWLAIIATIKRKQCIKESQTKKAYSRLLRCCTPRGSSFGLSLGGPTNVTLFGSYAIYGISRHDGLHLETRLSGPRNGKIWSRGCRVATSCSTSELPCFGGVLLWLC